MPVATKALAVIVRTRPGDRIEILVHRFVTAPDLPLRLPGGSVERGESPEQAVWREVIEETGLTSIALIRRLGVKRYYKPYLGSEVCRHDFLFRAPDGGPDSWVRRVGGAGGDAGDLVELQWIGLERAGEVDEEHDLDVFFSLKRRLLRRGG